MLRVLERGSTLDVRSPHCEYMGLTIFNNNNNRPNNNNYNREYNNESIRPLCIFYSFSAGSTLDVRI